MRPGGATFPCRISPTPCSRPARPTITPKDDATTLVALRISRPSLPLIAGLCLRLTASRRAARPAKASIAGNSRPGWPGRLHRVVRGAGYSLQTIGPLQEHRYDVVESPARECVLH